MKKLLTFLTAVLLGMTSLFATACDPDSFKYENGDKSTVGVAEVGANVTSLDIGWYMGKVCVEYAAVDGLETVSHVRQCSADDDRHRVLNVRVFHFAYKLGRDYVLVGKHYIFGLIVFFMLSHCVSLP